MTRNEFIAQFILSSSAEPCEGSSMSDVIKVGKELANALEEAKCAPWVVCEHSWKSIPVAAVSECQKCGSLK